MDLNKAMLIGNVTRDPEVKTTPQGVTVATFSIATNQTWNDASGVKQEKTEFHNIVAWRKLAEIIGQYVKKGTKVFIEGKLQTRSWDDPSGVKKYRTEVVADNLIMLSARQGGPSNNDSFGGSDSSGQQPAPTEDVIQLEDVPF